MALDGLLNSIPFDDLKRALRAVDQIEGERDFEGISIALVREFPGDAMKCMAIHTRMRALARLQDHPAMRPWSIASDIEDASFLAEPVMRAAAEHPFRNPKTVFKDPFSAKFDPDSFFKRVLMLSESDGSG